MYNSAGNIQSDVMVGNAMANDGVLFEPFNLSKSESVIMSACNCKSRHEGQLNSLLIACMGR